MRIPRLLAGGALVAASGGACGSGARPAGVTAGTPPPARPAPSGLTPTVPNCGGGAFEPKTLLIVCGAPGTMATGVSWSSWGAQSAAGTGTVEVSSRGRAVTAAARLVLGDVRSGSSGRQFTLLTVTWTGSSPDGHASDVYHLSPEP